MATSSKFDLSAGSPDRPNFPGGQRGAYTAASLSGSFREGMDNRILSSHPSMSRSAATSSHGDVSNFFHGLPFDTKLLAAGHKFPRQGDLNRVMTSTLGNSPGDLVSGSLNNKLSVSSLEELKRVKASLHDNSVRARDRVKILNETTSKLDKCFPNFLTRKRSRSDLPPSDRPNSSLLVDRTVNGGGIAKVATQSQTSAFETETPKLEEKTKNVVPSKRTRTSLMDVQMDVRAHARPPGTMERDREILGKAVQSEEKDQKFSNGIDGWEKSRMKKKRSGIKSEFLTCTVLSRPDSDQEAKRDMQQRLATDIRSRSSNAHGFRSGPSNGVLGVGKVDVTSPKTGLGMRSAPKNDQDNGSHLNDRRDHLVGSDKERVNVKAVNRSSIRENSSSSSPSSTTKVNTVTRGPRSGPGAIPKASANVHRSIGVADEGELSQNTNKLHTIAGASNRKRTPSARSSSPPVAQWANQRPQKIPRVARRSNFVSPLLNHDETPSLDITSNVLGNDMGLQRRSIGSALQQVKLKGDQFSPATLSESEESGAAEIKSKDRIKKSNEMGERGGQNVEKVATQALPSRKNKVPDEELGHKDGVRRQGRTLRGFTGTRSGNPTSLEKRGNAGTAKQLRSSRLGLDKIESKTGRPPTKKLSDRKAITRPRHSVNAGAPDFHVSDYSLGELDDGHKELLAAANAAVNSVLTLGHACSSTFWRQMEPIFGFVSAEDIAHLKQQQGDLGFNFLTPSSGPTCGDESSKVPDGFGMIDCNGDGDFTNVTNNGELEHFPEHIVPAKKVCGGISFCERLLSALIVEEGNEGFCDTNVGPTANSGHSLNGFQPDQAPMHSTAYTQSQYNKMSIDERLLLEVQSIGIFPEPVPDLTQSEDAEINEDISRLEEKLREQALKKKQLLCNLEMSVAEARETQERDIERRAFDKLVGMAYEKYMTCWGPNASCGKGMSGKIAKQAALAFVKRTMERCRKFEKTNESCFNDAIFMEVFRSVSSLIKNADSVISNKEGESSKLFGDTPIRLSEVAVSAPLESHPIPSLLSQSEQNMDSHSPDDILSINPLSEQATRKEDTASNKGKKRELLLDDVVGGIVGTSLRAPSGTGTSLSSGAKGKRSERDREGKGHNREMQSRTGTVKIGRPSPGNAKGERKNKAKLKQRTTQLSASVNGLLGKTSEIPKDVSPSVPESHEILASRSSKKNDGFCLDTLPDPEALDLSNLQIPEMDELGVSDDFGDQGQDLASWLNIDDDGMQDHDFMGGLEIPMDDLSELNMMV
ncbi:hypothetical protein IFM89_002180 [Coptis chinensis]|uniref:Uncharacterized protein n=1 Tax=Coptis chinensis TaxID=261450 RepID=A0A835I8L2_9MAGN|nr:hypothetical protein IFM89_002180 [Coptis chinensis]